MIIITHIIIKKYSVYPIDFVCFFDMDEIMRGAARRKPLNLSFFWVVRSEPPFVLYRRVHDGYQNAAQPLNFHPAFIPLNQLFEANLTF
jgi:hypothetical protein